MSVCRIRVQADRGGDPVGVDVALPSTVPVGELLPAILHLVDGRSEPESMVRWWRLDRPTGGSLIESLSLTENEVHDGELFVLASEHAPPLGLRRLEPCREVAAAPLPVVGGSFPGAVCMLAAVLGAVALTWSGVAAHSPVNLIVAALGAVAAAAGALTAGHPMALGLAAVTLAAATGFLAVPSGPAAPNAFLAAAAAFAAALVVRRLSGDASPAWSGAATLSVLVAVVTVVSMPLATVGALLTTASLGVLALAPRIAVLVGGLGPDRWTDELDVRAVTGHCTLTGLVAGCAAGAATGALLVAYTGLRDATSPPGAVAFSAMIAVVLLLRARSHVEPARRILLDTTGLISGTTSFVVAVACYPDQVGWIGGALIGIAVLAGRRVRFAAAASRVGDRLEYAALAAVVPLALWIGGAYPLVGGIRLS